jgi:nitrite reductase/ring-hydroxylating ferredoxin subunit
MATKQNIQASAETTRVDVGSLEDFQERSCTVVTIAGREVGIVRWNGETVYAVHNRCPHMGGPVCLGNLGPKIIAPEEGPGDLRVDDDTPVLACAWHRWEFDVATGRSHWDPNYRLKLFPAVVEDGRILVSVTKGREADGD